jgi:hypothetical protein
MTSCKWNSSTTWMCLGRQRSPTPANLADVLALFDFDNAVSHRPDRAGVRSSIKTVGRGLGRPLDQISASPVRLREQFKSGSAARAGVEPRSWISAKSRTLWALKSTGMPVTSSRDTRSILQEWSALLATVLDRGRLIGISRFLRFLSGGAVTPTTFKARTSRPTRTSS